VSRASYEAVGRAGERVEYIVTDEVNVRLVDDWLENVVDHLRVNCT